jgi:ProP effector
MGFEQLAKLRDELAKQANAQRKQKQAAKEQAAQAGGKDAKAKDAKPRDARPAAKPAAKPAGKPAQARPAARQNPVDPVVHTIGKLQKRCPLAFPKNPAPKVALKIGILEDLLAQAGELKLTEQEIRDAVSTWCRGSRYWASLTEGAPRVDLTGTETGKVTASDSAFARRRSGGRTKPARPEGEANAVAKAAEDSGKREPESAAADEGKTSEADQARG